MILASSMGFLCVGDEAVSCFANSFANAAGVSWVFSQVLTLYMVIEIG